MYDSTVLTVTIFLVGVIITLVSVIYKNLIRKIEMSEDTCKKYVDDKVATSEKSVLGRIDSLRAVCELQFEHLKEAHTDLKIEATEGRREILKKIEELNKR
jgi:hypothetical protein